MTALLLLMNLCLQAEKKPAAAPKGPEKFAKEIAAFVKTDAEKPFPMGGVVFTGSSSIRLWKLEKSFPELKLLNRGFGGSRASDAVHYAETLVLRHKPRLVFFYSGDNDIAEGRTPERVAADYKAFAEKIHASLPTTRIVFLSIKPSGKRWTLIEKQRDANRRIKAMCESDPEKRLTFVDISPPLVGADGKPRLELFQKDQLHLNEAGYREVSKLVAPLLK